MVVLPRLNDIDGPQVRRFGRGGVPLLRFVPLRRGSRSETAFGPEKSFAAIIKTTSAIAPTAPPQIRRFRKIFLAMFHSSPVAADDV